MLTHEELRSIQESPYKQDFPLFLAHPTIHFIDSAATEQRPRVVIDALQEFYTTMNANPLRGLYSLSIEATQAIEQCRAHVARFIGARDDAGEPKSYEVIFTRNTSESLNLVAQSLGSYALTPGDEVVISVMEHHSNLIPWQQVCKQTGAKLVYLYPNAEFGFDEQEIASKISKRTKIVSVAEVSNVLGVRLPLDRISARAREVGAYVVIDAAQSAPHMSVDVTQLDCDLLAFSAHKLGGPFGIGVLWGRQALLEHMPPFLTGGEMIDSVHEQNAVWAPIPQKFEAGTQDAAGIYAFGKALEYLEQLGIKHIEHREKLLARYLCERMEELDFITIIGPQDGDLHVGAVSFDVAGIHPHDVASLLDMSGVCIRAGHHCAEPLLSYLGYKSSCRASIAFYNDASDIDALIDGLRKVWQVFHGTEQSS